MRPDPQQILADANKLKTERFAKRDTELKARSDERYNLTTVDIPAAYKKTAKQHNSNIIEDEGRQVGTLIYAIPVPHLAPSSPEQQPLTTKVEQFLSAALQELEAANGPVWWQKTLAQVHDKIGWVYTMPRRVPYKGQPEAPNGEDFAATEEWQVKNDRYKQDAGISAVIDYRFVPTNTAYHVGPVYNPHRFYEVKEIPERDLMDAYGIVKDYDGSYSKRTEEITTTPSGYPEGRGGAESLIKVVEYWDKDWCMIVAESTKMTMFGLRQVKSAFVLEEWEHNKGRVPYFPCPAFVTEQLDEDKRFAGPIDGIYNEMPEHKRLMTMMDNVAHQTAFASYQLETQKDGDPVVDDNPMSLTFKELEPGKIKLFPPGSKLTVIPMAQEIAVLASQLQASQARLERYQLSPVAKGVSPGADTANAAISNLHRFQLSTLDPMAESSSLQAQAIFKFWLECIRDIGETVFVFDSNTDSQLSLNATEIVSVNVQAKATPDQGQFQLLIEKHAMELWLSGAITELQMHEMMGKENPEEYVVANQVERLRKTLDPIIQQQVVASLGMMDAVNAMIQENAQSGDARNAVQPLMEQAKGMQDGQAPTGMGSGAPGQPRDQNAGVRTSTTDVNTQEAMAGGY